MTYQVTNSRGAFVTKTITVTVKEKDTQNPTTDDNKNPTDTDNVMDCFVCFIRRIVSCYCRNKT
ncbi:hypothetical protein NE604_00740 [Anaerofustis stercorihominis]|uniref:hypothetical protein n=1 Tax=Anaerofustis stercorihominis TaxID=214853 RepID=UPI00210EAAB4|nr:hypothetical protein [Anaerofustis stercorihominis]MCQ4794171.1 hypothetical protein [Anaerofustis stercorihominis]